MRVGIVGCGASGILLILELLLRGIQPNQILVVDTYFDGGDLQRKWGTIHSNTRWEQVRDLLHQYPSTRSAIDTLNQRYTSEQTVLLSDIAWLLHESIKHIFSDLHAITDICNTIYVKEATYELILSNTTESCDILFLCQGGTPRCVDTGRPSIPLEIALNSFALRRYVKPGQIVSVFGLAHSGTIVCNHLLECGATIKGFYKSTTPFQFARDGFYDGIKQESAEIADRILSKKYDSIELYSIHDVKQLVRWISKSDWVISCVGFKGSPITILDENGKEIVVSKYNAGTAQIYKSIYGFGLAYPGVTEINGIVHKDISIPSFIAQIQKCLPDILKNNQS